MDENTRGNVMMVVMLAFFAFMGWTINRCRKSQESMAKDSKVGLRQQEKYMAQHRKWMREHSDDFNHGEEWRKKSDEDDEEEETN